MKILFIGATGMLGKPVAAQLIKAGFEVSLLARDEKKITKLFPGQKLIKGDVFDKASLEKAFAGHDIVYFNLSVAQSSGKKQPQPEREGIQNIIEAAKAAGIKRLAGISSLVKKYQRMNGFSWWSFDVKEKAVEKIKASGIPYSIFYPSIFMEALNRQMLKGDKIMLAGNSEMPMWFIAAEDYGRQVAKAFEIACNSNQEYTIQGPEAFTIDEAAAVFIKNYKHPLKTLKAPLGLMKVMGWFSRKMNYTANICEALNKYPEQFESDKTWADLGKPSISLAQYAAAL